jgi:subtilisin-like proprotein convertase family protein
VKRSPGIAARFCVAGLVLLPAAGVSLAASEAPPPQSLNSTVNRPVPDGDLSGLANTQTLPAALAPIQSVAVTLQLTPLGEGGFFGDTHAPLTRQVDGYVVPLNRSGRSSERPFDYSDGVPVQITLSDTAPGDIHHCRLTLQGDEAAPLTAPLTDLWRPNVPAVGPQSFSFTVNRLVPDGDLSGLADTQILPAAPAPIQSVAVTLQLTPMGEGGFFGDLYATLTRQADGYAVLLNRSGRSSERPFGYSDGVPVQITLSDAAPADIHHYRLTLQGDEAAPLTAPLTGLWQPDGRAVDPLLVLGTHPPTATLASFSGSDLEGAWTLFVADVSGGGEFRLDSWGIEVTIIPEPGSRLLLLSGLGGLAWQWARRKAKATTPGI